MKHPTRHPRLAIWTLCLSGILSLALITPAPAQSKLTIGEEIQVYAFGRWRDGVIAHVDQHGASVEFKMGGSPSRMAFQRYEIRKPSEVDAIDLERSWESADGKMKVDAALKRFSEDKVVLSKADGREVEVLDESLSKKDRDYAKQFKKTYQEDARKGKVPALIPKLPPLESFESGPESEAATIVGQGKVEPLGPIPKYLREFTQNGMGLYFTRREQSFSSLIPVGGPEQLLLVCTREDNRLNNGRNFQSEAYWVSLKQQKILRSVPLAPEDYIVDYDPRAKLLVSAHRGDPLDSEEYSSITVWNLKPGGSEAQPLVRWQPSETTLSSKTSPSSKASPSSKTSPSSKASLSAPLFVKLINDHTLLAKTGDRTYQAWDFQQKRLLYSFQCASFLDATAVLTPDRKNILLPEDGKVTVLHAEDGRLKFSLPISDPHLSGVNIDANGSRLVCLTASHVHVWDLSTSNPKPTSYPAPFIGSPFRSSVEWINDDMILAGSHPHRTLYRFSSSLPVWSYRMESDEFRLNDSPLASFVLNGLLFYVAMPEKRSGSIAVGAVELPGPKVEELTQKIDSDSIMLLKQGSRVGLSLHGVSDPTKVEKWLLDKIKANGWTYDPNARAQIHAEMGKGKTMTERYRRNDPQGSTFEVTFTPHFANLTIKADDVVVWKAGTSTGTPPIIYDSDIQAAVDKCQTPPVEFFQLLTLPNQILDPQFSRGFGLSKLGLKGIEVESTSPPGREPDPFSAPQKKPPSPPIPIPNPNPKRTGK